MLFHSPSGALAARLRSMWSWQLDSAATPTPGLIAPDAHVEFVLHLGTPCAMQVGTDGPWREQPRAFLLAQSTGAIRLAARGQNALIAFRTDALVAATLLGRPLADLWDRLVPLQELIGSEADRLLDLVAAARPEQRFTTIEQWLCRRLSNWSLAHEQLAALQSQLFWKSPDQSLSQFARRAGVTDRSLRRWYDASTGRSPKQMALSGRVLRACALLREQPQLRIADVAQASGFFDHAAFAHAFAERVGLTPAAFRAERLVFYERGPA